jgi:peptidoglycan/xylan/chitin deacetylase (PgdA/CDA1 family)
MRIKSVVEHAAHALGAAHWIRARNRSNARILMYHRFPGTPAEVRARLTAQCEHLSRHYHSISLTDLAEAAHEGRPLPPNSLAITVDDGYRDFAHAFPVFNKFQLKVTLYVVSSFAAGELWLWPDQLLHLIESSHRPEAIVPVPGEEPFRLDLANPRSAFDVFAQKLIRMKNKDRLTVLNSLPALLETELPKTIPGRFAPLSWEELRNLSAQGLDIGAHTDTHPILSSLETEPELRHEIAGSKVRIAASIGVEVSHFCYPNGMFLDINDGAVSTVSSAGYKTAVLAESGLATPPFDLFRLKRVGVDPDYPPRYFERRVAGYRL